MRDDRASRIEHPASDIPRGIGAADSMDFVIIANAWGAGVANPTSKHRIALELARRGHRVLWVEGAGMRRPSLGSGADRSRMLRKVGAAARGARPVSERIWALSPLLLPLPALAGVRRLNGWLCAASARRWARRLTLRDPVLINYVPVLAEAMGMWRKSSWFLVPGSWFAKPAAIRNSTADRKQPQRENEARGTRNQEPGTTNSLPPARVVYHCVDRWDAFRMYDARLMARVDDQCCRHADLVIATSQDLLERCLQRNPHTVLVPHGVDYAHFARALDQPPRPADLPAGPVVGFFGLISEWMEQDLVARTAAALPSAHVVLIGTADVPVARLQGIPNLHLLGPRAFNILPDYVAHFTVGIIPFRVDDLTRAVNPIKLREMLSAGCPVVSTALPEVERYADGGPGVGVARDAARFVALVSERLASPLTAEQRRAISRRMAAETWEAKVGEILGWIAGRDAG